MALRGDMSPTGMALAAELELAGGGLGAEEQVGDLLVAHAHQAGEAEDFAAAQLQRHVPGHAPGHRVGAAA